MAGKKGATHARPRNQAERDLYALTKIEQILDDIGISEKKKEINPIRLKALEIRYNKLRPALSAIEQTNVDATRSESEIMQQIKQLVEAKPELLNDLLPAGKVLVSVGSTVVQPQQTLPDAPKPQNSGDNDAHYEADKA